MENNKLYDDLLLQNSILPKQLNLALKAINSCSYSITGNYFNTAAEQLNKTLKADYTFIGQLKENTIEIISLFGNGKILKNFSYEITNTPSEKIIHDQKCSYSKDFTSFFSEDTLLQDSEIGCYIGVPLFNSAHKVNGILVSLFRKPLLNPIITETILLIFGARISAEIEHKEIYKNLESAQDNPREKEEKFELLFEHSGTANTYFSLDGFLIFQNTKSASFFNATPGDLDGKSVLEMFGNKVGNTIMRLFKQVIETKEKLIYKSNFNLPVGERWFKNIFQPVFDSNKNILGIHVISQEITDEKEAELKLIRSEKNYSSLVETTSDLITKVDSKGNFIFINHASNIIYGLPPEKCIGLSAFDFVHPDDYERTIKSFNRWLKSTNKQFTVENRQLHKNGSSRPLFWNIRINRDEKGNIIDLTSFGRDMTEQKKLEKELISAKQKAEESDRLKTAFLSNMSHEIRTPMNGILGFTELLAMDNLTLEKRTYFSNIVKSSSRQLMGIISDIIDISKIEAGEFNLCYSTFSAQKFITEIIGQIKIYMQQKNKENIKIIKNIDSKLTGITSDRNRLSQILLNLLTNAIKFTEKGEIEIRIERIEKNKIRLSVKDSGVGIDKSNHEIIFQRFRQAKEEDSFKGGTGLGLAICKLLTEKLNGEITVHSKLGKGSTFEVTVPSKEQPIPTKGIEFHANQKPNFKSNIKILIAEDEKINFFFLSEILCPYGFLIYHAWNGKEAVKLFKQKKPDIILMDIKMPVMDGFEAFNKIRQINKNAIVIALTAYALSSDEKRITEAGFNHYLSKPVTKTKLIQTLNSCLNPNN